MPETDAPTPVEATPDRRKLVAILYADMVGYSRLVGLDDVGTLNRLKKLRQDLIDPAIDEHGGRIVHTGGDSLFVVFDSIDGAVRCAMKVQQQVPLHNRDQPPDRAIRFRIGINIGDAIADGADLHGDAVNVAARLQAECPPGGICVTRPVRDYTQGRLALDFEQLGALNLKNIAQPIEAFVLRPDAAEAPKSTKEPYVLSPLDRPSIAILPFQNMSGDPEQEYFADGIVEEIITALSRISSLRVIARNSSFAYRGKSYDVRRVGKELGARYILEGSVRKAAARVRITGQLIDAATGVHLWANRFEGNLTDIFGLQDQVTVSVVGAIEPTVRVAEIERALRKPTKSLEAYDLVLRGRSASEALRRDSLEEAARLYRCAIEIDPNYALAYALLARALWIMVSQQWVSPSADELAECADYARTAVRLGQADAETLCTAANMVAFPGGELAEGIAIIDRALALNPNSADALAVSGMLRAYAGDTEMALRHLNEADRLSSPGLHIIAEAFGFCLTCFVDGDYSGVLDWTAQSLHRHPANVAALRYRTAALVQEQVSIHEKDQPEDQAIRFRIGINLGDAIPHGTDLYGDAVNVAARLQAECPPGRICVSRSVRDHVHGRLGLEFDELGPLSLKNIARPVEAFLLRSGEQPSLGRVSSNRSAPATLVRPRLSILVGPIESFGFPRDDDYLLRGVTQDVATDLTRVPGSFVVSRDGDNRLEGDLVQAARQLGVSYVVHGSIRRAGAKATVATQLISTESGAHVWANRLQTDLGEIPHKLDEITGRLVRAIATKLIEDVDRRIELIPRQEWAADDFIIHGRAFLTKPHSIRNRREALKMFGQALLLDRNSVAAQLGVATVLMGNVLDGWSSGPEQDKARAEELLRRVLDFDNEDADARAYMGTLRRVQGRLTDARIELEMAVALAPNNVQALGQLGITLTFLGQPKTAVPLIHRCMRLAPYDRNTPILEAILGLCQVLLGEVDEAIPHLRKARLTNPRLYYIHAFLAAALALRDEIDEAADALREAVRVRPEFASQSDLQSVLRESSPEYLKLWRNTIYKGLLRAGLPQIVPNFAPLPDSIDTG
jgi:adenylate cyclase